MSPIPRSVTCLAERDHMVFFGELHWYRAPVYDQLDLKNSRQLQKRYDFFTFSCALLAVSESALLVWNRFGRFPRSTTIDIKLVVMFSGDPGVV